ncbi:MAG: YceI family protein [Caulobacteraceae bacterium]|nr:YceI family protein [Caulobacteraceae bacterium]
MTTGRPRYTAVAIGLHWLIAAALVFQIILGWRFSGAPRGPTVFALFQLHKSVGITILVLTLARIAWRVGHPPPPPPVRQPAWERVGSKIVHFGFYAILIGLPLTGWIMVSTSKLDIPTLLYGAVAWPHLPIISHMAAGPKQAWETAGRVSHHLLAWTTYALLALHLGAVAKHQLIDRDEVFSHMAPGAVPGWREPRAWTAALIFAALVAFALLYTPANRPAVLPSSPGIAPTAIQSTAVSTPPRSPTLMTPPAAANRSEGQRGQGAASQPESPKGPVEWRVQPGSSLGFTAKWSGEPIEGRFTRWTAKIHFSPDALDASRLEVAVDPGSASTGDAQRDASLAGEDFFDVNTHPRATYTATRFRKTGEGRYVAIGAIDLRGVKKPLEIPFTLAVHGNSALAKGSATVNRTDFGVGRGEWAATDQIAAGVTVAFHIEALAAR